MNFGPRDHSPADIRAYENCNQHGAQNKYSEKQSYDLSFHISSCGIIDSIAESFHLARSMIKARGISSVFVLVHMPALEFALKLDQADGEIIHAGQVDWRGGTVIPSLVRLIEKN